MKNVLKPGMSLLAILIFSISVSGAVKKSQSTFVLVHGSWHGDWAWYLLEEQLIKAGHEVITVNLPGHGLLFNGASDVTLQDYESAVVAALDAVDEKVILVGHSLGGLIISAAAEKRPQKIECLVYLAAFLLQDQQSVLDISVQDSTSLIFPNISIDSSSRIVHLNPDHVEDLFYENTPAESIILSRKLLTPEPLLPLSALLSVTDENYGSIDRYYIATGYDKAISPYIQESMYTASPCKEVFHINSGHSPFFSNVPQLKNILSNISKDRDKNYKEPEKEAAPKDKPAINIYPNPAGHSLHITIPANLGNTVVQLSTLQGDILLTRNIANSAGTIEVSVAEYSGKELLVTLKGKGMTYKRRVLCR